MVRWQPKPWNEKSAAAADQRTPDLAPLVQEIIDRPGWRKDNAIALLIAGSGKRVAKSFDGDEKDAPRLFLELEETSAGQASRQAQSEGRPNDLTPFDCISWSRMPIVQPGQRVFDVALQGQTALRRFDIVDQAGGPFRSIVKEFNGVPVAMSCGSSSAAPTAVKRLCCAASKFLKKAPEKTKQKLQVTCSYQTTGMFSSLHLEAVPSLVSVWH